MLSKNATVNKSSKLSSLVEKAKSFAEDAHRINSASANKRNKLMQTNSLEEDMAELQRKRQIAAFEAELDKMLINQYELTLELVRKDHNPELLLPLALNTTHNVEPPILASDRPKLPNRDITNITTRKVIFADRLEDSYIIENNRSLSIRKNGVGMQPLAKQPPIKHYAFEEMRQAKTPPNLEQAINLILFILASFATGLFLIFLSLSIQDKPNNSIKLGPG